MRENALRMGAKVVTVEDDFGQPVDPAKVEAALAANPQTKVLAFVHAETSTGVRSDAQSLCALARAHAALSIVDAVTSLGGIALAVDDWGIQQTRRQCGGPCYWTMDRDRCRSGAACRQSLADRIDGRGQPARNRRPRASGAV